MPQGGYRARGEQAILFSVAAWDVNCPQHIPQRFEATDVAAALAERDGRIAALEAESRGIEGKDFLARQVNCGGKACNFRGACIRFPPLRRLTGDILTKIYEIGLDRNAANHQPLTPLTLLERAAKTYPDHNAIIHGSARISYRDFWRRSLRLASALGSKRHRQGRHRHRDAVQHAGRCWRRISACRWSRPCCTR